MPLSEIAVVEVPTMLSVGSRCSAYAVRMPLTWSGLPVLILHRHVVQGVSDCLCSLSTLRLQVVMDMGMVPCDGSQVQGTTGRGRMRKFYPVTILYSFGWVMGM
jgi:hypothetical protein